MDWDKISDQLKAPLDPKHIKPPPAGKFGEYVDGLHVIREANRIFGFNGWSYTVERLEQTHSGVYQIGPGKEQFRCSFLCAVRVNVGGVIREGLAVGTGNGKPENAGDVIESAVKEAETDALKRALRTFGNTFGLALYEKDKAAREVASPPPKPVERDPRKIAAGLIKLFDNADTQNRVNSIRGKNAAALDWLADHHAIESAEVEAATNRALARTDEAA